MGKNSLQVPYFSPDTGPTPLHAIQCPDLTSSQLHLLPLLRSSAVLNVSIPYTLHQLFHPRAFTSVHLTFIQHLPDARPQLDANPPPLAGNTSTIQPQTLACLTPVELSGLTWPSISVRPSLTTSTFGFSALPKQSRASYTCPVTAPTHHTQWQLPLHTSACLTKLQAL